ncbi:MAG: hypothetical protein AB1486_20535 [Planctomycetota bacterium]
MLRSKTVVVLGLPGSPLGERLVARLDEDGVRGRALSLDAPLLGLPVTVDSDSVLWQEENLLQAAAILVERPLFPWPQPRQIGLSGGEEARAADREGRSLALSALLVAADCVPVLNPPAAAHLAVAPAIALDLLEARGVPVHPWRLAPLPEAEGAILGMDASGRDRWHEPEAPRPGEPAILYELPLAEVVSILVVGPLAAGTLRHPSARAWAEGAAVLPGSPIPVLVRDLALRAAATLGLAIASVSLATSPLAVLHVDAAPDLALWDRNLEGGASTALASHLATFVTREPE